ncbi:MAG: Ig-like domain-containing protein, partial [Gemmatimonadaceae bacterium]
MRPSPSMARAAIAAGVLATAAACQADRSTTSPELESAKVASSGSWSGAELRLTPDVDTVQVGETAQLSVSLSGGRGAQQNDASFSSLDERIATVSPAGVVTGRAGGTVQIVARLKRIADTATVVVAAPVAAVAVAPDSGTITIGQTATLKATATDALGNALNDVAPTWESSDSAVASVSTEGVVTARGTGEAVITASISGKNASARIRTAKVAVASIELSAAGATLVVGQTYQVTAAVKDASGSPLPDRVVTWTSSDEKVVTVSGTGLVTAVAGGSATITATVDGKSAVMNAAVNAPSVASVSVSANATTLKVGETTQLTAVAKDAGGATLSGQATSWASSNEAVATVSGSGLVTAVGGGSATISATIGGKAGSVSVSVGAVAVASVAISGSTGPLSVGQTTQLSAAAKDASGSTLGGRTVTWGTSDAAIVTVSSTGLVAAVSAGSATISATVDGVQGVAPVTVSGTTAPVQSPGAVVGVAELPRQYLQTSVASTPSGGQVIRVAAGGDLQAALDQAQLGDQVVLDAGATFVGNFTLPAKSSGSGWITIRSSGTLPAEGERMTAAKAAQYALPKILTGMTAPTIATAPGAHHYRIMGVEIGATTAVTFSYSLVNLGTVATEQNSLSVTPHHLILDRVYVHGHSGLDFARCVGMHAAAVAVIDSYVSECHGRGRDSQAVWGANGPGPFKIVNNYLEGAGEVVMFGGDDSRAQELLPHDIEVRHNHITRPAAWKGVWLVKNLLELKEGVRVLVEGNVLENHWADAQDGFAVVLKAVDQYGSAPWTTTQDVTVRSNILRNISGG